MVLGQFPLRYCDVVLKPRPMFVLLPKYAIPWWDNLIKVLSPTLKAKSTMDESLDFSLSRGSFMYNVEKSYVAIDLARFFIYII